MAVSLDGRRALVTGASGGIGAAIALSLAGAGADLVLSYSSRREAAQEVARGVRDLGRAAAVLGSDLSAAGAGRLLAEQAGTDGGPIDVLVANAGTGTQRSWDEVDDELWQHTYAVNVTAPWQLTRAVLPGMIERGFGRILYLSSVAALNGGIIGPHYASSKAALHGLMHHVAPRVAGSGVTVNTIAPALITGTGMLPGGPASDEPGHLPMPVPVGHLGRPEDIAAMALAMLTNPYLTDKVITVDGGLYPA